MCTCISEINERLKLKGVCLDLPEKITLDVTGEDISDRMSFSTNSIKSSKKSNFRLVASYCPFCGEKYLPEVYINEKD